MSEDAFERRMNQETDALVDAIFKDPALAIGLMRKLLEPAGDLAIEKDIGGWLRENTAFKTDFEHIKKRVSERMASDLHCWCGRYELVSDAGDRYVLAIADMRGSANYDPEAEKSPAIYLGLEAIAEYEFADGELCWKASAGHYGEGRLSFSTFTEHEPGQADREPGIYFQPYCSGQLSPDGEAAPVGVKGKIGVYSARALAGDYSATDPIDHWAGRYILVVTGDEKYHNLSIIAAQQGNALQVTLDSVPIEQYRFSGNTLTWPGKVNNVPVNAVRARLQFNQSTHGSQYVVGTIFTDSTSGSKEVVGMRTGSANAPGKGPGGPVSITTEKLPPAKAGDTYEFQLHATGAAHAIKWTCERGLPPGLVLNENGMIAGKAEQAGLWSVTVTAAEDGNAGNSDTKDFELNVGAEAGQLGDIAKSALGSGLAALSAIILALIGGFIKSRFDRSLEKHKIDLKKQLDNEQAAAAEEKAADAAERVQREERKRIAERVERIERLGRIVERLHNQINTHLDNKQSKHDQIAAEEAKEQIDQALLDRLRKEMLALEERTRMLTEDALNLKKAYEPEEFAEAERSRGIERGVEAGV